MNVAEVWIWDTLVGAVAWDESQQLGSFEYANSFKALAIELAPLMMPLTNRQRIWSFPALRATRTARFDAFKGLPGMLADALPDRFGTTLINRWLASQGRPDNSLNPIERLCFVGSRGMGALTFRPASSIISNKATAIEIDSLVEISRSLLMDRSQLNTNLVDQQEAVNSILQVGTSAGGARPKAVIAYNEKTGEVRSGQADAPAGFKHWLLKIDGASDVQLGASSGFGRVEMAYYQMAIDAGIDMMPSKLLEENGRAHFMTQRFDRGEGQARHHVQTLCAMKHYDYNNVLAYSYEQLFQTMRELRLPYSAAEQMYKRMVFNVLARNCDDHTKNFSFRLKKGGRWELAPAYDICFAYRPGSAWVSQHALSIGGKRSGFTRKELVAFGKSIGSKRAGSLLDKIAAVVEHWPSYAERFGVSATLRDKIYSNLNTDLA